MNVVIAQSGGPTGVINASLLGVYRQARQWPQVETVLGALHGVEGILQNRLVPLNGQLEEEEQQALLRQTPAAALGSCRYKLPAVEENPAVYETIRRVLEQHDVGAFFYIGGNDSMDTVDKLAAYFAAVHCPIRVMGVPKTIDNDLVDTDHTPGYGSAAKYVATVMREIIRDCTVYELKSVTIVEIMGRDTGWLTLAAALPRLYGEAAPHLVYLPEVPFSEEQFVQDVRRVQAHSDTVIVAVSEGVRPAEESCCRQEATDGFGHRQLAGAGKCLEEIVRRRLGCKVRAVELNTPQRCAAHVASAVDVQEAEQAGAAAVKAAMEGATGQMVSFSRSDGPYRLTCETVPVSQVANRVKYVPRSWINEAGNDVLPAALEYVRPLVEGALPLRTEGGLPCHFRLRIASDR